MSAREPLPLKAGSRQPRVRQARWLLLLSAALVAHGADAADPAAGKLRSAAVCSVCHGATGLSSLPNAPHLAGQPAIYVSQQLRDFRSGKRSHEMMTLIAKSLSDQDIEDIAAWYASIEIDARERR